MHFSNKLKGKRALITGSSKGIGLAVAARFAADGASVSITHRTDSEYSPAVLQQINSISKNSGHSECRHVEIIADIRNEHEIVSMFSKVYDTWQGVDIVVNNAGIQTETPGDDLDIETFQDVLSVNLVAAASISSKAIRHFLSRSYGGVIINTSSVHERIPKPDYLAYSVSKGGLGNLTRTLALEFADRGIRVNAVAPGAVVTDINHSWIHDASKRRTVEKHIPMKRAADPEEIAPVYSFLASSDSKYITGQTIYACGGLTLYGDFAENWSS